MTYIPEDQLYKSQMKAMAQQENDTSTTIKDEIASLLVSSNSTAKMANSCDFFPFDQSFKNAALSKDMRVNGTLAVPLTFSIKADATYDTYIRSITAKIMSQNSSTDKFGGVAALTNGLKFVHNKQGFAEKIMREGNIKNILDFYRLGSKNPPPETTSGGLAVVITLLTYQVYQIQIDLSEIYGYPSNGLKLRKGTTDNLSFVVQDNLTSLNEFNIIGSGTQM